ncbi:hypothetical protein ABIA85_009217 [Bradyrhizobium sp. LA6.10]
MVHRLELAMPGRKDLADLVMAQRNGGDRGELRGAAVVESIGHQWSSGQIQSSWLMTSVRPRSRRRDRRAWEDLWRQDADRREGGAIVRATQSASRRRSSSMLYGDVGSRSGLRSALAGRLPVPGEQLVQLMVLGSPGGDALQHVSQVDLRVELMELCCVHDRLQGRPALGATFAAKGVPARENEDKRLRAIAASACVLNLTTTKTRVRTPPKPDRGASLTLPLFFIDRGRTKVDPTSP